MLDVNVHPGALDLLQVGAWQPIKLDGPPPRCWSSFCWRIQMLTHAPLHIYRQSDVQNVAAKGGQHITSRCGRNELLTVSAKKLTAGRLGRKLFDVHICRVESMDDLCSAFAMSCDTTLTAPAFKKLAFPPFVHQSE